MKVFVDFSASESSEESRSELLEFLLSKGFSLERNEDPPGVIAVYSPDNNTASDDAAANLERLRSLLGVGDALASQGSDDVDDSDDSDDSDDGDDESGDERSDNVRLRLQAGRKIRRINILF